MIEKRRPTKISKAKKQISINFKTLPQDFLRQIQGVFSRSFSTQLAKLTEEMKGAKFEASGEIFSDEIVLGMSITVPKKISATSAFASVDFDPKASSPSIEDLLGACVDALGSIFQTLFSQKDFSIFLAENLNEARGIPFDWSEAEVNKIKVYVRVDKSHPSLEAMADQLLMESGGLHVREADEDDEEDAGDSGDGAPPGQILH